MSGQRSADEFRSSRLPAPHARGFDGVAVEQHDVLLARRARVGCDIEAEPPERVEQERTAHLERDRAAANAVADGNRLRLRGRELGMRRDRKRDEGMPVAVVSR